MRAGYYAEQIKLKSGVRIVGEGQATTRVEYERSDTVVVGDRVVGTAIEGLSLGHKTGPSPCGDPVIECTRCVGLHLYDNRIEGSGDRGVVLMETSGAEILDNAIVDHYWAGVVAWASRVSVIGNRFENCHDGLVLLGSHAVVEDNALTGIRKIGVVAGPIPGRAEFTVLRRNVIGAHELGILDARLPGERSTFDFDGNTCPCAEVAYRRVMYGGKKLPATPDRFETPLDAYFYFADRRDDGASIARAACDGKAAGAFRLQGDECCQRQDLSECTLGSLFRPEIACIDRVDGDEAVSSALSIVSAHDGAVIRRFELLSATECSAASVTASLDKGALRAANEYLRDGGFLEEPAASDVEAQTVEQRGATLAVEVGPARGEIRLPLPEGLEGECCDLSVEDYYVHPGGARIVVVGTWTCAAQSDDAEDSCFLSEAARVAEVNAVTDELLRVIVPLERPEPTPELESLRRLAVLQGAGERMAGKLHISSLDQAATLAVDLADKHVAWLPSMWPEHRAAAITFAQRTLASPLRKVLERANSVLDGSGPLETPAQIARVAPMVRSLASPAALVVPDSPLGAQVCATLASLARRAHQLLGGAEEDMRTLKALLSDAAAELESLKGSTSGEPQRALAGAALALKNIHRLLP